MGTIKFFCVGVLFFIFLDTSIYAEEKSLSNAKLIKKADKLFINENFVSAHPLYSKLHSENPEITIYAYRLGVCTLFAMDNKEKSIPLLESVVKNQDVDKEVYYYLGKAYMFHYKYEEAIAHFKLYKETGSPNNVKKFQIDRQIEMCMNGICMTPSIMDWNIIDQKRVERDSFLYAYDTKSVAGKLFLKSEDDFYNTSLDYKYEQEIPTVHENKDSSRIHLASYGYSEEGEQGKNIYLVKKLPNGEWAKAQKLPSVINSNYDEDYPFLQANEKTLFFSSKGHNSIGGYDIFKSIFNDTTNSWSIPENMGVPINSPDDDILFVTDSTESGAFYSSAHNTSADKLFVYKLTNEKKNKKLIHITGLVNQKTPVNVAIDVIDLNNCDTVGIFKANKNTGKYFLVLPNEGKYLFKLKSPDFKTQCKLVEVKQNLKTNFKMLYQTISNDLPYNSLNLKMVDTIEMNNIQNKSVENLALNDSLPSIEKNNDIVLITDLTDTATFCPPFNDKLDINYTINQDETSPPISPQKGEQITQLPISDSLFYSVQVGLYSKPKSASVFFNIQPLYYKKKDDEKIMYSVGVYDNLLKAEEAKNIIRALGIIDAFVIAFKNSQQIPVSSEQYNIVNNQQ